MSNVPPPRVETEVDLRARVSQLESELQRLRSVEVRRNAHLGHTPLAMIFWDPQFRVLEWNPAAERIFGYSAAEAIGRHGCELLVTPDVRPHVEQVFRELLCQSGGRRSTNDNLTKNGRLIRCEWYNTPLIDERRQVFGVASIAQDITDQETTAEALRHSEDMLRLLLDHAPDVIMRVDRQARISYINHVAAPYRRDQVIGRHMHDFVPAEQQSIVTSAVERVFRERNMVEYEVQDSLMGRWYHTRLAPLVEEGEVNHLVAICVDIHDRKLQEQHLQQSQRALTDSEQRYRALADNIPGIVFTGVNDEQLSTTYVNKAWERILGYSTDDILNGRVSFSELIHPEDRAVVHAQVEAALAKREPYHLEYRARHADGHWIWLEEHSQGVFDSDGRLLYLTGTAFDITARRNADEELRQRDVMFRVLAQNVPGVVYLCRNDQRYSMIFLNDAIKTLVGVPAEEFLQDRISFVDLYHPDDATAIPPIVNTAIGRRMPYHLTYRLRRADDSYLWVEEYGQGVFDAAGELQFLEGTIFDISAKRAAVEALHRSKEELEVQVEARTQQLRMANRLLRSDYQRQLDLTRELQASEQQFRVMCDANPAAVTIARLADGEIIYANERMVELMGVPANEIIGHKTIDFYHDMGDRQLIRDTLLRERQMRGHEIQVRRPDGQVLWVNFSMCVLELAEGPCVLGIMLDVTDRRHYDERLKHERRLLRRLLDLNQRDRQLIAYEIHDGFVQDVTGAIMFLQSSVRKIPPDGPAQKDLNQGLDILRSSIDEARRLIDGLQPGVLEQQGVVEGVRYLAQQTERMHGIDVELDINVSFERLAPAVEQAIYRIVQEALNNVAKHSQSPRARVVLSQRTDALVIKVRDWGIGFDTLKTKTRRYGLTGIRDRARLLGGEATIRSDLGRGTKLRIRLPLQDVLIPPDAQQPHLSDDDSSSNFAPLSNDTES